MHPLNNSSKQQKVPKKKTWKKFGPFLDLCVSSLRRGHANLLCIVPILSDVSEETTSIVHFRFIYSTIKALQSLWDICCNLLSFLAWLSSGDPSRQCFWISYTQGFNAAPIPELTIKKTPIFGNLSQECS